MTARMSRSQSFCLPWLRPLLAAILVSLLPVASLAEPSNEASDDQQRPFFGISPYLSTGPYTTIQRVTASIDTDFGVRDRSSNTLTNLGWMFQLGLQTQRLDHLPGKPRVDVSGGILIPTSASGTIGSKVTITTGMFNDSLKEETKLQVDYNYSYRAGVGVEFLVEILPVDLRITPGVNYLYLDSRYVGSVDSERSFISQADPIIRTAATKVNLVQHFVGPSLRIGTEPMKVFGFEIDVFLEGTLYLDVNGTRRSQELRDAANRRASFNWEAASSAGLVSAGLRIRLP